MAAGDRPILDGSGAQHDLIDQTAADRALLDGARRAIREHVRAEGVPEDVRL